MTSCPTYDVMLYIWCHFLHMTSFSTYDVIFYIWRHALHMMSFSTYDVIFYIWRHFLHMTSFPTHDVMSYIWRHFLHMTSCSTYDVIFYIWRHTRPFQFSKQCNKRIIIEKDFSGEVEIETKAFGKKYTHDPTILVPGSANWASKAWVLVNI